MDSKRRSFSLQQYAPLLDTPLASPDSPMKRKAHKNTPLLIKTKETQFFPPPNSNLELQIYLDSLQPIKEGYLYAKSRVYIQLTRQSIKEYNDETKAVVKNVYSLKEHKSFVTQQKQFIKILFPEVNQHILYQARDEIEAKMWVSCIKVIEDKFKANLRQPIQEAWIPRYFGADLITEDQFLRIVDTGDILLFETNNTGARIQRSLTKSQFDHVGIAIKVAAKYLYVFDANADSGVTFLEWHQFIEINDLYDRVAIRKLCDYDKTNVEKKLIEFLQFVHGKRYEVTLSKLFRKKSLSPSKPTDSYFCSELVAKALKHCGLLESEKASSSFWPVEFARSITLTNKSYLMDPITVILKKHLQK